MPDITHISKHNPAAAPQPMDYPGFMVRYPYKLVVLYITIKKHLSAFTK